MDLKKILLDALMQEMQKRKAHDQRVDQNIAALKAAGWSDNKISTLQASARLMDEVTGIIRSEAAADMMLAGNIAFAKMLCSMIDAAILGARMSAESAAALRHTIHLEDDEPSPDTVIASAEAAIAELERRRTICQYVADGGKDVAEKFGSRAKAWREEADEASAKIRAMHETDLAMRRAMQQASTVTKQ